MSKPETEPTSLPSDEELMLAFQRGHAAAFDTLLQRHEEAVLRYFVRFLGNRAQAEEAAQEVFLHVIRAAHRYEPRAKFSTWLYRIMRNYAIDCSRRLKHRRTQSLDQPIGPAEDDRRLGDVVSVDESEDIETETADREVREKLQKALETLNPDQREVFLMRENMGLAFHEIADVLHCSTNTVKSRMRYAISALRKQLIRDLRLIRTER